MLLIKTIHLSCVLCTIIGFLIRGAWMLQDSPKLHQKFAKIAPHIIDTVLLISGITLAVMTQQNPFVNGWLLLKIVLLLAYILCGAVALKYGRSKKHKKIALIGAVFCLFLIVLLARQRHSLPFLL